MNKKTLAILATVAVAAIGLAGCQTTHGTFPRCDAQAPPHYKVHMAGAYESDGDAAVVAQSAQLMNWTNVVVHGHAFKGSDITGDCHLSRQWGV